MDMSYSNCWDCPTTVLSLALEVAVLIAVAIVATWLLRRKIALLQAFGAISLILTSFFVLTLPVYVPRWGVFRPGSESELFSPAAVRMVLVIVVIAFFIIAALGLRKRSRTHAV